MYLSNRDLKWAISTGQLIFEPKPDSVDATSIDLHLGDIEYAKVWDIETFAGDQSRSGIKTPELRLGSFDYKAFGQKYLIDPPTDPSQPVFRRGDEIVVKPSGFLLWQTRQELGTPEDNADLICFVNAKSTKARTGIMVHFTAPTIHASWSGTVTLEIINLGPFHFVLSPGDSIAQLTVARITSVPDETLKHAKSATFGQTNPAGLATPRSAKKRARKRG